MPDAAPEKGKEEAKGKGDKDKAKEEAEADLSEEDLELKANLEMLVTRLGEGDTGVQKASLEAISKEIRSATTSMTSVPKPLKFLRAHYKGMTEIHAGWPKSNPNSTVFADILSVLAMTSEVEGSRDSLKYRLIGGSDPLGDWGHEYVRHLAGEIAAEYKERADKEGEPAPTDDLIGLVTQIIPYHMTHNAEPEAVDLLVEVLPLPLPLAFPLPLPPTKPTRIARMHLLTTQPMLLTAPRRWRSCRCCLSTRTTRTTPGRACTSSRAATTSRSPTT